MPRFKPHTMDPEQLWLLPPSLDDLIAADSEVRLIADAIDEMDIGELLLSYSHTGRPPYDPSCLVKVLLFAYSKGVRSSRKIQELVTSDVRFMWLARGDRPDFHTIARFRKEKWEAFEAVFAQSVRLCARAGLVLLESVSIDGTKVKANAAKNAVVKADELRAIEEILREAEAVDAAEDELYGDSNGPKLPEEMKDPTERRKRLRELLDELEKDSPKQVSTTDPESRFMHTRNGIDLCFNTQAAVDSYDQVVVAADVVSQARDQREALPMLDAVESNVGMKPGVMLADAGYSSEETLKGLAERGQAALIPSVEPPGQKNGDPDFAAERFVYHAKTDTLTCPAGKQLSFKHEYTAGSGVYRIYGASGCQSCPFHGRCVPHSNKSRKVHRSVIAEIREQMRRAVKSQEGQAVYAVRKETVEPVFGILKQNFGFRRFLLRGLKGAKAEVALFFTAYNLMKWAKWAKEELLSCLLTLFLPLNRPQQQLLAARDLSNGK